MFCWNCGNQMNDEELFCSRCGASMGGQPTAVPIEPSASAPLPVVRTRKGTKQKKGKKWLLLGLATAAVVCIAVVAWMILSPKQPEITVGDESFRIGQVFEQDELEDIYRKSTEEQCDDYDGDIPSDLFASETCSIWIGSGYNSDQVVFRQTDNGDWEVRSVHLRGDDSSFGEIYIGDSVEDILEKYPEAYVVMDKDYMDYSGSHTCHVYMDKSGKMYDGFEFYNTIQNVAENTEDIESRIEKLRDYFVVRFLIDKNGEVSSIYTVSMGW